MNKCFFQNNKVIYNEIKADYELKIDHGYAIRVIPSYLFDSNNYGFCSLPTCSFSNDETYTTLNNEAWAMFYRGRSASIFENSYSYCFITPFSPEGYSARVDDFSSRSEYLSSLFNDYDQAIVELDLSNSNISFGKNCIMLGKHRIRYSIVRSDSMRPSIVAISKIKDFEKDCLNALSINAFIKGNYELLWSLARSSTNYRISSGDVVYIGERTTDSDMYSNRLISALLKTEFHPEKAFEILEAC